MPHGLPRPRFFIKPSIMRLSNLNSLVRKLTAPLAALSAAFLFPLDATASISGEWEIHPSFEKASVAILDSPRFTYFLLLQQNHVNSDGDLADARAALFRRDRLDPGAGITDMAGMPGSTILNVRTALYNQQKKYLMAVSTEGVIEIYPDEGETKTITDLAHLQTRSPRNVNSITFTADGEAWIAADFGIVSVDAENGRLGEVIMTDRPVMHAARFKEGIVVIDSDNKLYDIADGRGGDVSLAECPEMTLSPLEGSEFLLSGGKAVSAETLMPLTDRSFLFFGPHSKDPGGRSVNLASLDGDTWRVVRLFEENIRMKSVVEAVCSRLEGNALPTVEGYYIHSNNVAYHIKRGVDPDFTEADPAHAFKKLTTSEISKVADAGRDSGTCDMTEFWFNSPRVGFYSRRAEAKPEGGFQWSDPSAPEMPAAPVPYICPNMTWHPDYGFLLSNRGQGILYKSMSVIPWQVSGFRQGKWENHTPAFYPPSYTETDEEMAKLFRSGANGYPLQSPRGFAIDPDDPRFAYAGSLFSGFARIDLSDPSAPALHIGSSSDLNKGLPGFVEGAAAGENWAGTCDFTEPSFDYDHNLWLAFNPRLKDNTDNRAELWCFTPQQRKAMENANTDVSLYQQPTKLTLPLPGTTIGINCDFLALAAEANRNILIYTPGGYDAPVYVIDHKGTISDASDDVVRILDRSHTRDGRQVSQHNIVSLYEDVERGRVWVCSEMGAFSFSPTDVLAGVSGIEAPLTMQHVNCVAADGDGRLWFGAEGGGVTCLGSDGTILGSLDSENSPLPSDRVYGIGYNPERGSMFFSTSEGVAEFFPSFSGGGAAGGHVRVSPRQVTSSWHGWVTITGLPDGVDIEARDSKGARAASLGKAEQGRLQWNTTGADGTRLPTGSYGIFVSGGQEPLAEIKIFN